MSRKITILNSMSRLQQVGASHLLVVLVLFSCMEGSKGEMICPPALDGEAYKVIAEYNNFPTDDVNISWAIEGVYVANCSIKAGSCKLNPMFDKHGFNYGFLRIGNGGLQATLTISNFTRGLHHENRYSVIWEFGKTYSEDCEVKIGNPENECLTQEPCLFETRCTDLDIGYSCVCEEGYSGWNCNQGDDKLYCNFGAYKLKFSQQADSCTDIQFECFVARNGFKDRKITIDSNLTSQAVDWFDINPLTLTSNISFEACVFKGAPEGIKEFDIDLWLFSDRSKIYPVKVIVVVSNDNIAPTFNTQTGVSYNIDVKEDLAIGDVVIYVNKSQQLNCKAQDGCIQVVDIDRNSQLGIDSLSLTVSPEGTTKTPGITFTEKKDKTSLGYFSVSGKLIPMTIITFKMIVTDGNNENDEAEVIFNITDVNDPPVCDKTTITASLDIAGNAAKALGVVNCTDPDVIDKYKRITYEVSSAYQGPFDVTPDGVLWYTLQVRNPSTEKQISFNITATGYSDTPSPKFEQIIPVVITLTAPEPKCNLSVESVPKLWQAGSTLSLLLDCNIFGLDNHFKVVNVSRHSQFTYQVNNVKPGLLRYQFTMTNYLPKVYTFTIVATLGGPETTKTVNVPVFNQPSFPDLSQTVIFLESKFGRDSFSVQITNQIGSTIYTIKNLSSEYKQVIGINNQGKLSLLSKPPKILLNKETTFTVEVKDTASNLTATASVKILIVDVNEPPTCAKPTAVAVKSNTAVGTVIMKMNCQDPDVTKTYTALSYSVSTSPSSVSFTIDNQGVVTLAQPLPSGVSLANVSVIVRDSSLDTVTSFDVSINEVNCPEKQEQKLTFPATPAGQTAVISCPPGYNGQILRNCSQNQVWSQYSLRDCTRKDMGPISDQASSLQRGQGNSSTLNTIAKDMKDSLEKSPLIVSGDVKEMIKILSDVGKASMQNTSLVVNDQAIRDFASVADSLLAADDKTWEELEDDEKEEGPMLLQAFDQISSASLRSSDGSDGSSIASSSIQSDSELIVKKNIAIKKDKTLEDIVFPVDSERKVLEMNDWELDSENTAYLSKEAFKTKKSIAYSVVLFRSQPRKFKIFPKLQRKYSDGQDVVNKEINTNILSLTVDTELGALSSPLELTFSAIRKNYSTPSCGFLDTGLSDLGVWSTRGCEFVKFRSGSVVCHCHHLTNFAVLMSPGGSLSSEDTEILGLISIIGCAISIFCLVATIIVYIIVWKYVKCDRSVLHLHLCVCLIVAYVIFLAGVNRTEDETLCTVIAALLHYFFLVVFFIMLSEGIEVFKSVTMVFSGDSILCKLLPLIYGVPLVIVAVSLGVTRTDGYGTDKNCWLSLDNGLLWAFVGPVLLVLLINLIILILVLRTMQKTRHMMSKTNKQRTKSVVRTICVLSPLLGITWVFGVLSVNEDAVIFQYLFVIFNTLQGLFIFIFQCILPPQVRDGFRALRRKHRARSFDSEKKFVSSSDRRMSYSDSNSAPQYKKGSILTDVPSPVTSLRSDHLNPAFNGGLGSSRQSHDSFDTLSSGFGSSNGTPRKKHRNGELVNGRSPMDSNTESSPRGYLPTLKEGQRSYSNNSPDAWNYPANGGEGYLSDKEHLRQIYGGNVESLKPTPARKAARDRWKKLQHLAKSPQSPFLSGPSGMAIGRRGSNQNDFYPSPFGVPMDARRPSGSFSEYGDRRNSLVPLEITKPDGLLTRKSINYHTNI